MAALLIVLILAILFAVSATFSPVYAKRGTIVSKAPQPHVVAGPKSYLDKSQYEEGERIQIIRTYENAMAAGSSRLHAVPPGFSPEDNWHLREKMARLHREKEANLMKLLNTTSHPFELINIVYDLLQEPDPLDGCKFITSKCTKTNLRRIARRTNNNPDDPNIDVDMLAHALKGCILNGNCILDDLCSSDSDFLPLIGSITRKGRMLTYKFFFKKKCEHSYGRAVEVKMMLDKVHGWLFHKLAPAT